MTETKNSAEENNYLTPEAQALTPESKASVPEKKALTTERRNSTTERRNFTNRNYTKFPNRQNTIKAEKAVKTENAIKTENAEKNVSTTESSVEKTNTTFQKSLASKNAVKITFLGGVGEIGKNMTVFETDKEMIILDCGLTFPDSDLPGIDVVVPDISYILANKHKLKAVIVTHGHEDHIGGLPYLLSEVNVPVYGSRLTLALLENKMREHPRVKFKGVEVKPKNILKIGGFTIEFIKVSHSIAGALAVCITTPAGNIVHTGDFKIDFSPIDGEMTDLTRFGEIGKRGVQLLMCESTNVTRPGYSMSESNVGKCLEEVAFKTQSEKRLLIATFASNIHRLQQIMDLAEKYKRKVAFTGRSMLNVSEVAMKVGELHYNRDNVIDVDKVSKYADSEVLIISTGSQGEPMSALTRMASDEFAKLKITSNDTVVISASPIPGNEKNVYNVINRLYRKGVNVIYDELADVHTSGHACQEEIKMIHALTKPKFFIPVHGEYRHMKTHKDVAVRMGMEERRILIPDIGTQIELTPNTMKVVGITKAGMKLVDGMGLGDTVSNVLKDRKQLSEDGFCVAILNISGTTAELKCDPIIVTRGVVYNDEADGIVAELKTNLSVFIKKYDFKEVDPLFIKNEIRKFISNFIFRKTKRRPITLAMVVLS